MTTTVKPSLTIQTASLWASGDQSSFSGFGGPAAFDPFLGEFSDVVSSAGLALEPFADTVYDVDAGDQVTFVIAVQNISPFPGYNLKLRDTLPVGFAIAGFDLTVTDGAGNPLAYSGNLFSSSGGLIITAPLAAYSGDSGANVVLVTFTAYVTNGVSVPGASLTNNAQIVSFAASDGGTNLSTGTLSATAAVQTNTFGVTSTANQPAATLTAGHTASFDITVSLPEGSLQDFRIDEVLPQIGTAWLQLVSAQIVSIGGHLTASAPINVQPTGAIQLGTVIDVYDNLVTADDDIVVRVTVAGGGTSAGSGNIQTVVSVADPNGGTARISRSVTNTVTLGPPDKPPSITGASTAQFATSSALVLPFQTLKLVDLDIARIETLTIHTSDPTLGTLSAPSGALTSVTTDASGDLALTGTVGVVQALAQALLFTPAGAAVGTETFALTLDDGAGGIVTASTALDIAAAAHPSDLTAFPISTQTVLTSTATGSSTVSHVQTYAGALSDISTQYLYDGDQIIAIAAQQSGMLISSAAQQTAIALKGGVNVLDIRAGSGFLTSGTGTDTVLLHVDQVQATWNTIVNFHAGDSIVLYGFAAGTSTRAWSASDGAAGYTGATLRIDVDGNGSIDSNLTLAGKTLADTDHFTLTAGSVGGSSFLSITAT